ncbi:hypothetical protein KUM39_26240 [Streptomyces sp. J2-1]|uniref:hypothetical protein n=1 Tax=Streptomyces corallincola TaxID=2851888 RepID=UPI001C380731|nr:hypothetical protein [Streptomyces corallincola]MBV2357814.1 hypothetical protein [Streptomyces corallincola]
MRRPKPRTSYCPSCRRLRGIRIVGHATLSGDRYELAQCADRACELIWAIPAPSLANVA